MTDRQEPLTPASGPPMKGPFDPDAIRERVERAAREHTEAARQEAADTSGLRERLYAAVDTALTTGDSVHAAIEHALSQEPTPVERPLALMAHLRRIHDAECGCDLAALSQEPTPDTKE